MIKQACPRLNVSSRTYKRVIYQLFDIKIQIFLKATFFYAWYRSEEIAPWILPYIHAKAENFCPKEILHTFISIYFYTCIIAYMHSYILSFLHTCILACLHTCIFLQMETYWLKFKGTTLKHVQTYPFLSKMQRFLSKLYIKLKIFKFD